MIDGAPGTLDYLLLRCWEASDRARSEAEFPLDITPAEWRDMRRKQFTRWRSSLAGAPGDTAQDASSTPPQPPAE